MALPKIFEKKINIAGREVPLWVVVGAGGGVLVLFLISRSGSNQPTQNPIDVAKQIDELTSKINAPPAPAPSGGAGEVSSLPDVSAQLSAWSAGFGKELSQALAAQSKSNEAAMGLLQRELEDYQRSASRAGAPAPAILPTPEAIASPIYSSPAAPYIPPAPPTPTPTPAPFGGSKKTKLGTAGVSVGAPKPFEPAPEVVQLWSNPAAFGGSATTRIGPQENPELSAYNRYKGTSLGSAGANVGGGGGGSYTVVSGDVLSRIAKRYGVSLSSLLAANPQISNANLIRPGQVIQIPG